MSENSQHHNLGKACFISPLVAPFSYFFVVSLFSFFQIGRVDNIISSFFYIMVIGLPFSYVITLVFGLPIYQLLKNKGWLSLINITMSGVVLGSLFFLYFGYYSYMSMLEIIKILSLGGIMGGSVAFTFGKLIGLPLFRNKNDKFAE